MKTRFQIQYVNIKSDSKPVPYTKDMWPPSPLTSGCVDDISVTTTISSNNSVVFKHEFEQESGKPYLIYKNELNNLVLNLNLNKDKSVILDSGLQKWNLLHSTMKISIYRGRDFTDYFNVTGELVYFANVEGLVHKLQYTYTLANHFYINSLPVNFK